MRIDSWELRHEMAVATSTLSGFALQQRLAQLNIYYYSRGKGGRKSPRTFSGVARARRAAVNARNKAA